VNGDMLADSPGAAAEQLQIAVGSHHRTSTISLKGEWDIAAEPRVSRAIGQALRGGPTRLRLDLSRLSFMDASGVHIAVELRRRSDAENFCLVVIPGPSQVQRIFEICQRIEATDPARERVDRL
jgi:anti-anti-sigma factor